MRGGCGPYWALKAQASGAGVLPLESRVAEGALGPLARHWPRLNPVQVSVTPSSCTGWHAGRLT